MWDSRLYRRKVKKDVQKDIFLMVVIGLFLLVYFGGLFFVGSYGIYVMVVRDFLEGLYYFSFSGFWIFVSVSKIKGGY